MTTIKALDELEEKPHANVFPDAGPKQFGSRSHREMTLVDSELTQRIIQYASDSVLLGFGLKLVLEKRPTA